MSEDLKEWIAMFAIFFLIIISIVNVIFNFTNYRKGKRTYSSLLGRRT